jgi:diaminopimelate decarboxylase (EC 4.1.1.20)
VASAGVLLTRVEYVKRTSARTFLVCDAGMHTLLRPALYDAFHFLWPTRPEPRHIPAARAAEPPLPDLTPCDVVGPVCESADFLARQRPLPTVEPGQLLAVFTAGAYGHTMASNYNSHPLPAEVLVDGSTATLIRRRQTIADLVEPEFA